MKRQVIYAPLAREEFEDAVAWYEGQRPGLGDEFKTEVGETLRQILRSPERFRLVAPNIHKATVQRFPYSVYFSIELSTIHVVSVFHGARNPMKLLRRLN